MCNYVLFTFLFNLYVILSCFNNKVYIWCVGTDMQSQKQLGYFMKDLYIYVSVGLLYEYVTKLGKENCNWKYFIPCNECSFVKMFVFLMFHIKAPQNYYLTVLILLTCLKTWKIKRDSCQTPMLSYQKQERSFYEYVSRCHGTKQYNHFDNLAPIYLTGFLK